MSQRSRRTRWVLASVAVGAAVAAGAASLPAMADDADQTVSYHGYEVDVPSSWRVVDLDADPNACVRFDTPTVYLGTPGKTSDCPASIEAGRTAGLVVSKLDGKSAGVATADTARVTAQDGAGEAKSVNDRIQLAVEDAGVLVSAVHNSGTEKSVRGVLDSARLVDGADAAPRRPEPILPGGDARIPPHSAPGAHGAGAVPERLRHRWTGSAPR